MRLLSFSLVLFLIPFVFASDLSDYPMLSTPVQVVVGAQDVGMHSLVAVDVMYSLAGYDKKKVFMRLDSEVVDFSSDFVLIGNPCQNSVITHFYPDSGCALDAEGIYYLEKDGQHIVTLTAATDARLRELGKYLRLGDLEGGFSSPFSAAPPIVVAPVGNAVVVADPTKSVGDEGPQDCIGCFSQGQCLGVGQVTSVQGEGYFCDGTQLLVQQGTGSCSLASACLSGECYEGQCVPLATVSSGFFGRLWQWVIGIF